MVNFVVYMIFRGVKYKNGSLVVNVRVQGASSLWSELGEYKSILGNGTRTQRTNG